MISVWKAFIIIIEKYFTYFDAAYIKPNKFCSILGCLFLLEHLLLNILGCLPISHVTSFHSKTNN